MKKTICICGGGNIGHVIAGYLSLKENVDVSVLTSNPSLWSSQLLLKTPKQDNIRCNLLKISDNPNEVIPNADIILLCLPNFAIEETLIKVKEYVNDAQLIGSVVSSGGFFWIAKNTLKNNPKLFGFQRVPFVSRTIEYGKYAELKGFKSVLKFSTTNNIDSNNLSSLFSDLFDTPCKVLNHYLEATLTNSNPILHPARLYGLFHAWDSITPYENPPLFYEGWNDYSSEILILCDEEFQKIVHKLPLGYAEIPSILDYYESTGITSLTKKMKSITAFKDITTQMKVVDGGFIPDFEHRYFTEDVNFGLLIIKYLGLLLNVETPTIDTLIIWAQKHMNKSFLVDGQLTGNDICETGIPSNYGIRTKNELLKLV